MTIRTFYLGVLGAMAKGAMPYGAKIATGTAASLLAVATLDASQMWSKGSDSVSMPCKTRALPEIWSTYPKVAETQKALVEALETMNSLAGKDLENLQGAMKAVSGGCAGCHKLFRAEKKS